MRMLPLMLILSQPWAQTAHASDESVEATVAQIRTLYNQVGLAEGGDDLCFGKPCLEAETSFVRMMPGTGPQLTHVRFFYAEHLPDEEEIYGQAYVRKAVVRYNIAAQEYYVEYLYSGVEPKLVFHFQSDAQTERRTWLDDGKAIRMDVRPKGDPVAKTVRDGGFSAAQIEHVNGMITRADAYRALFSALVGSADGEMGGWPYEGE